jgi:hypothetical protein
MTEPSPEEQVRKAIAEYGRPNWLGYVPMSIVRQVPPETLKELILNSGKVVPTKRDWKYQEMWDWCHKNAGTTISAYSLADMFGFSPPTTRKFIKYNPSLFRVVGHGFWEIRDVKADRAADGKP